MRPMRGIQYRAYTVHASIGELCAIGTPETRIEAVSSLEIQALILRNKIYTTKFAFLNL